MIEPGDCLSFAAVDEVTLDDGRRVYGIVMTGVDGDNVVDSTEEATVNGVPVTIYTLVNSPLLFLLFHSL